MLLGSGVSTGAGVPTGWQIVERLIIELAVAEEREPPDDAFGWYASRFGHDATYSEVVAALGLTEAERQALVSRFIEGDEGPRPPSAAHRALARLVAGGWVRVIITTNFDRLTENALVDAGVDATVLASPAAIGGALPLEHVGVALIKLHGDQRDPTILNTEVELTSYPPQTDALLDRVVGDYGLLVCGWSADHDHALREAIERAPNRRFTTFWATRSELSESARALAALRQAEVIEHVDADTFFGRLADVTEALASTHRTAPHSVMAAVAVAKRELAGAHVAIPLHDTIRSEIERVQNLPELMADPHAAGYDQIEVVNAVIAECEVLVALTATAEYWGRAETDRWWMADITRMARRPLLSGSVNVLDRPRLPGLFMAWSAGTAAVATNRENLLTALLALDEVPEPGRNENVPALLALSPDVLHVGDHLQLLYRILRPIFVQHLALGRRAYVEAWERWQYLVLLAAHDVRTRRHVWVTAATRGIRVEGYRPVVPVPHGWALSQVQRLGSSHPLLRAGYFNGEVEELVTGINEVDAALAADSERADYDSLPSGGGVVPSGLHYPGHFSDDPDEVFRVPDPR